MFNGRCGGHQSWPPAALQGILCLRVKEDLQRNLYEQYRERHVCVEMEGDCDKDFNRKGGDIGWVKGVNITHN